MSWSTKCPTCLFNTSCWWILWPQACWCRHYVYEDGFLNWRTEGWGAIQVTLNIKSNCNTSNKYWGNRETCHDEWRLPHLPAALKETCFKRCLEGGRSVAVLGDPGNDYHVMCMYVYIYVHRCLMSPILFGEWGGSHHWRWNLSKLEISKETSSF